ncbi:hypothetical protein PENSPDRAFT_691053 [Peniophora sp. CONT]|nr:hypothetical protein PENSPDRAFT_691053 [Peniophora sp. CONT]
MADGDGVREQRESGRARKLEAEEDGRKHLEPSVSVRLFHWTGTNPTFEHMTRAKNEWLLQKQHHICGALALTTIPEPNDVAVYASVVHTPPHGLPSTQTDPPSSAFTATYDTEERARTSQRDVRCVLYRYYVCQVRNAGYDRAQRSAQNDAPLIPRTCAQRPPLRRHIYPHTDLRFYYFKANPLGVPFGTTWSGTGRDDGNEGERC